MVKKNSTALAVTLLFLAGILLTSFVTYTVTKARIKPEVVVADHIVFRNRTVIKEVPVYHNETVIKYLQPTRSLCQGFIEEALNESNCTLINHSNIRNFITDSDCAAYCVDGHKVSVIVGDKRVFNGHNQTYTAFNNYADCLNNCGVGSNACACWVNDDE